MESYKTLREICSSLGVSRRAVQGYEKAGLVGPTERNKYGHLLYDEVAQERIAQIKLYQQMGFTIKEIRMLIDAPKTQIKHALEKQVLLLEERRTEMNHIIQVVYEMIDALT